MIESISLHRIREILERASADELINTIEKGFSLYSQGKVNVPPVGHLAFKNPPGDVHIKYGFIEGDDYYVIKIASGFYENPSIGLSSGDGMMVVLSQRTGQILALLLDQGHLTDIRTAVAGAIAAKYLAPQEVHHIGIVGTGVQARLQLKFLGDVCKCRDVIVWGRDQNKLDQFQKDETLNNFHITTTLSINELVLQSNLIVTTTASEKSIIKSEYVQPGTHITAMGADAPGKQEIDPLLFSRAGLIVADSKTQCIDHGDIGYAVRNGSLDPGKIIELGEVILEKKFQRKDPSQITIADLTGVAIQDIQIAKYVYLNNRTVK